MSRYEDSYGTDWTSLEKDEAIDRAYALGVAASLGQFHAAELEAIRDEVDSAYDRSVVELAFDEGRTAALEAESGTEAGDGAVWSDLVEGRTVTVDPDDVPTGGRQGLPEAIDKADALDRVELDHRDATELPEFLERD